MNKFYIVSVVIIAYCIAAFPALCLPLEDSKNSIAQYGEMWNETIDKGKLYLEAGLFDEAIDYFHSVVIDYPSAPSGYYYLGISYYLKEDLSMAERNLEKALAIDPYYPEAYYHLALVEYKKGNKEKVIRYLDEVTLLDETFHQAYYNKGVAYLDLGEPEKARKEFERALNLSPTDYASLAGILQAKEQLEQQVAMASDSRPAAAASVSPLEGEDFDTGFAGAHEYPLEQISASLLDEYEVTVSAREERVADEEDGSPRLFLATWAEKRPLAVTQDEVVTLTSSNDLTERLEIDFRKPRDVRNNQVQFSIKKGENAEGVEIVMRERTTKRSPHFYITDGTNDWDFVSIYVERVGYTLNLKEIEHIRLVPIPKSDIRPGEEATVFIRGFTVK